MYLDLANSRSLFVFATVLLLRTRAGNAFEATKDGDELIYGVDVSFPIHHATVSTNYAELPHNVDPANHGTPAKFVDMPIQPLGDRQTIYDGLIKGCHEQYKGRERLCDSTERDRIAMNMRQPRSMQNYTELGFKKIKAPDEVFNVIKKFWDENKDRGQPENWNAGNTYTNHWTSPTKMVSVEDGRLRGAGSSIKSKIWAAAKHVLEEWTGEELTPCSLYGIRTYHEGAVLASHVDRLPLVSSAIINVAQDVDEDWPIEVYAHDGRAYNVSMKPGEMVLYESHSVVHGRPFPLKGRLYANIFIHFEPVGHSLRHNAKEAAAARDIHAQYKEAVNKGVGGHEGAHDGLPPYISEGTEEAKRWKQSHPGNWHQTEKKTFETGSTEAHHAAGVGDIETLKKIAKDKKKRRDFVKEDANGWQPIHEGARGGHTDVIRLLINNGADVNARTNHGEGGTALWW
eukprot:CAMPEP_0195511534 /NCGR_PEP_ID=MMETSP0794_2-20130614/3819_1 /TAXON_ID=515487 /ORGANISM="Stephanopyxis turris, Strain CCMP 815" /LENGTH=456 /DNA_ID=CAMNT_0040639151 /DNA_START=95 /DNA_END=1462 /DNA_ORIENTATION=-